MPVITVEGPKINDTERKRKLVASITEAAYKAYGLPRSVYVVYIKENNPDNVAVGGELLCDRDKK